MPADERQIDQDLALVKRMLHRDERAMGEFCSYYLPRLYRFALQRLPTPEDADDVVQVVLSNASRRIETYRGQSTLFTWLLGICRREVSKQLASVSRDRDVVSLYQDGYADQVASIPGPAGEEPESMAARRQLLLRVRESLDRLPERQALALELKYVDGYSSQEIAAQLDLSDDAVQSLLARARRTFREVCDERIVEEFSRDVTRDTESHNGDRVRLE
ncbi:MAG: sigma-70 family RNA polymerase sigma factor [Pseudomonadales bacterium]